MRAHHFAGVNVRVKFLCPYCKHLFTRCADRPAANVPTSLEKGLGINVR